MKKKIAVLCTVLAMAMLFTVGSFAADGDTLWNFWRLLSPENVNYLGILGMLIESLITLFRFFLPAA